MTKTIESAKTSSTENKEVKTIKKEGETMKHRLVIAGSRTFNDYELLKASIKPNKVGEIISGCAQGADTLGEQFAKEYNIPVKQFPADWNKYGRSAGYLRNEEMAKYSTAVIVFWDGQSKGTKHMIDLARKHNRALKIIMFNEKEKNNMKYTNYADFKIDEVIFNQYTNTGLTSIQLMNNEEGPIATATVNPAPYTIAELNFPLDPHWNIVVDTNNCGAEMMEWLVENNIAIPTKWVIQQGYCQYPVMRLTNKR